MLPASWQKNDKKANTLIISFSVFVFALVSILGRYHLNVDPGFDVRIFAKANAVINSIVAVLLVVGLLSVKSKNFLLHKRIMLTAMVLSVLFLLSYICHHLFTGEARYGDVNHDNILSAEETAAAGSMRYVYYFILGTHIPLAGLVLPLALYSAYRALTGDYDKHKKLVRFTWPLWLYVAITGVIVYFMISPYYG